MLGALKTIRRGERRETLVAFSVLFLVLMSHALLETARDALFLGRLAPAQLPWVYIGLAAASLLVAELHGRLAGATSKRSLAITLAACGAITALFWALLAGRGTWMLYALYLWPGLIAALVMLEFWTLLGDAFTITQAKRVYGAIGVGSVAGSIAGSALASWASEQFSARHLLLPAALGLLLSGGVSLYLASPQEESAPAEPVEAPPDGLARGALQVLAHPYARGIVVVAVLGALAVTLADYLFKSTVAARVSRAELGSFFARAYLVYNLLSFACQTLFVNLAIRKLGVPLAAAFLPAVLLVTGAGTLILPILPAVVLVRGADASLRHSLHRTAFELLSVPLHARTRALVKRLIDIVGFRGGQALASLAILGIVTLPRPTTLLALVLVVLCALWLFAALRTRAAYVELFRRRMGKGQITHLKEFPELDAASLETVIRALDSDDDREVIAAIEVLERDDKERLVPKLLLFHPSHEVVRCVLALFARSGRKSAVRAIDRLLAHTTPAPLRAAALAVRAALDPATVVVKPEAELGEPEEVRAAFAVCRTALFGADRKPVDALSRSGTPATRLAIAEAIAATECHALGDVLIGLARDPEHEVRNTAIAAMGRLGGAALVRALVELMASDHTRAPARDQLVAMGDRALEALASALAEVALGPVRRELGDVIARLDPEPAARVLVNQLAVESDGLVRYRLIRSLEGIVAHHPGVDFDRGVIRRAIADTLSKAYRYLAYEIALERGGDERGGGPTPGCRLLKRLLRDKRKHAVGRLFRLLGLALPAESFAAAYRGVTSDRPELRANAIELMENVLPSDLRAPVLGLVEDLSPAERLARGRPHHAAEPVTHEQVLSRLLEGPAKTLREAAIYHTHELSHAD
jgi:ATP:ADP antiporter, AAA family